MIVLRFEDKIFKKYTEDIKKFFITNCTFIDVSKNNNNEIGILSSMIIIPRKLWNDFMQHIPEIERDKLWSKLHLCLKKDSGVYSRCDRFLLFYGGNKIRDFEKYEKRKQKLIFSAPKNIIDDIDIYASKLGICRTDVINDAIYTLIGKEGLLDKIIMINDEELKIGRRKDIVQNTMV